MVELVILIYPLQFQIASDAYVIPKLGSWGKSVNGLTGRAGNSSNFPRE